jgi:exonuclease III
MSALETPQSEMPVTEPARAQALRVASWNMAFWNWGHYKSTSNRRRQWAFLLALGPDIAFLQECRPEDLANLAPAWANDEYEIIGSIPRGWVACSAVLARRSLTPSRLGLSALPAVEQRWFRWLSGYVVPVSIKCGTEEVVAASVHAPAKVVSHPSISHADHDRVKRNSLPEAWYDDFAAACLRSAVDGHRFVVGGDWNIARLFDLVYAGHWPVAGQEFFDRAAQWGWRESLRKFHPDEVRTYLHPGCRPYELDHLFTDDQLHRRMTRCDAIDDGLVRELSDHAPLIADLDVAD